MDRRAFLAAVPLLASLPALKPMPVSAAPTAAMFEDFLEHAMRWDTEAIQYTTIYWHGNRWSRDGV